MSESPAIRRVMNVRRIHARADTPAAAIQVIASPPTSEEALADMEPGRTALTRTNVINSLPFWEHSVKLGVFAFAPVLKFLPDPADTKLSLFC